jgi:hypothetical protein
VRSVVDVGCGDWQFSRLMDWSGMDYLGIDAVAPVIQENTSLFAKPGIRFQHLDVVETPPPPADVLILKDVLQHWPFASIHQAIPWFSQYKYVLITNDDAPQGNIDTSMGGYRPLDVRKAPFHLRCTEVLRFASLSNRVPCTKVTLLYKNERYNASCGNAQRDGALRVALPIPRRPPHVAVRVPAAGAPDGPPCRRTAS